MFDEIEQFIRKAAQAAQEAADRARAEQEAKRRPPQQQQPPQRPPQRQKPRQQQRPQQARTPPRVLEPIIDAEVLQPIPRAPLSGRPAEQLAYEVELADEKMQSHVHEVFDHKLGRLQQSADTSPPSGPAVNVKAVAFHELLTQPGNLRNAVILAEILKRPEF